MTAASDPYTPNHHHLWRDAVEAALLHTCEWEDARVSDDEEEVQALVLEGRGRIVRLADGDFHVCSSTCPHAERGLDALGRPNGDLVCPYTGRVVHRVCEVRTDCSTGRSTFSCDLDSGLKVNRSATGEKQSRRDPKRASATAFASAAQIDDSEMPTEREPCVKRKASSIVRRSATCVGLHPGASSQSKRSRTYKQGELHSEAATIFSKIVSLPPLRTKSGATQQSARHDGDTCRVRPSVTYEDLFGAALRKYIGARAALKLPPQMSDIEKIQASVKTIIAEEAQKEAASDKLHRLTKNIEFCEAVADLGVSIFTCSCRTPYIDQARRGADAFKPFCLGVIYAFKRGVVLPDGTTLIPKIQALAPLLSGTRGSDNLKRRTMHSRSHRGLCTLHRSIASIDQKDINRVFHDAIAAARRLENFV